MDVAGPGRRTGWYVKGFSLKKKKKQTAEVHTIYTTMHVVDHELRG